MRSSDRVEMEGCYNAFCLAHVASDDFTYQGKFLCVFLGPMYFPMAWIVPSNVDILGLADPINIEEALFWCGTTSKISHAEREKVDRIIPLKTC